MERMRLVLAPVVKGLFTERQGEIIQLAADGLTIGAIAEKLGISPKTVAIHIYGSGKEDGLVSRIKALTGDELPTGNKSWLLVLVGDALVEVERRERCTGETERRSYNKIGNQFLILTKSSF